METLKITNLSNRAITFRGNSGNYYHLAPGEPSVPIDKIEVIENAKIRKLAGAGLISVPTIKEEKKKKQPESHAEVAANEGTEITETESKKK